MMLPADAEAEVVNVELSGLGDVEYAQDGTTLLNVRSLPEASAAGLSTATHPV